jgi:ABC-type multidrug transport system ATPase subunit
MKKIEFTNLGKSFGEKRVLKNVSFSVKNGSIHGLIGNNGAGKTTIFAILCNLITKFDGEALIDGKNIKDFKDYKKKSAFMFADPSFPCLKKVEEYFYDCAYLRGVSNDFASKIFCESALYEKRNEICSELSTGWKKILHFLTIDLVQDLEIVFLDEPFEGLDIQNKDRFVKKVIDMKNKGITVLISSHNLSDLQMLADDITFIDQGVILYSGKKTPNIRQTYEKLFKLENSELKETH